MKISKSRLKSLIKEELDNVLSENNFLADAPDQGIGLETNLSKSEKIDFMRSRVGTDGGMPVVDCKGMNANDIMAAWSVLETEMKGWYDSTGAGFINVSPQAAQELNKLGYSSYSAGDETVIGGAQQPSTFDKLANI